METNEIIEIKEIASSDSSTANSIQSAVDNVNSLLKKGWVLLNTYTTSYDPIVAKDDLTMHYVLGLTYDVKYRENSQAYNIIED